LWPQAGGGGDGAWKKIRCGANWLVGGLAGCLLNEAVGCWGAGGAAFSLEGELEVDEVLVEAVNVVQLGLVGARRAHTAL
jgi:hypothetical protein